MGVHDRITANKCLLYICIIQYVFPYHYISIWVPSLACRCYIHNQSSCIYPIVAIDGSSFFISVEIASRVIMSALRPKATEFRSTHTPEGELKQLQPTAKAMAPAIKRAKLVDPQERVTCLLARQGCSYAEYVDCMVVTVPEDACSGRKSYPAMEEGCSVIPGVYWRIGKLANSNVAVYRQERLPPGEKGPNKHQLFLWLNEDSVPLGWYISSEPCDKAHVTHYAWIKHDANDTKCLPKCDDVHIPFNASKRVHGAECLSMHFFAERNVITRGEDELASNDPDGGDDDRMGFDDDHDGCVMQKWNSGGSSSSKPKHGDTHMGGKGSKGKKGKDGSGARKPPGGGWFNRAKKLLIAFKSGNDALILELTEEYANHTDMKWLVDKEVERCTEA